MSRHQRDKNKWRHAIEGDERALRPIKKPIHRLHKNGLFNPNAPFWSGGDRAEDIVRRRVTAYKKKKTRKKKK